MFVGGQGGFGPCDADGDIQAMMDMDAPSDHGLRQHYARPELVAAITDALAASGYALTDITSTDLSPVDEFHVGGARATTTLFQKLAPTPDMTILDIGCGIGGPARHLATHYGCTVTGVDLSEDYITCGQVLNQWVALDDRITLHTGSALSLQIADDSIDLAYMLHVGMNIADKASLMQEVGRVLTPGGRFAIYDIMQRQDGTPHYPLPWAEHAGLSALGTPSNYRKAIENADLQLVSEIDHTDLAIEFFASAAPPGPLGLHILMGPSAGDKARSLARQIKSGILAPIEMIAQKPPQ